MKDHDIHRVEIREIKGLKFECDPGAWEWNVIRAVVDLDEYQVEKEKPERVIDIGAHIGAFTVLMASRGSQVHAYEPVPQNFRRLKKNCELNGVLNKVRLFNEAVIDSERMVSIKITPNNTGHCHLSEEGTVMAQGVSFKEVMEKFGGGCDLLKIDCEGAEYLFMEQMREYLPAIGQLRMELDGDEKTGNRVGMQGEFIKIVASRWPKVLVVNSNAKFAKMVYAK